MASIKTFISKMVIQIDKNKIKSQISEIDKQLVKTAGKFSKAFTKSFGAVKKIATSGIIAGAIAKMVNPLEEINQTLNNTLDNFDNIGRIADQLGIGDVQSLSALMTAFQAKGVDRAGVEKILNELQTEIGKSKAGDETARFSDLDVDENALSLLVKIMNKIASMDDADKAKALAVNVFGEKEASRLFDALRSGEEFQGIFGEAYLKSDPETIRRLQGLQGFKSKQEALQDLDIANERAKLINQKNIDTQLAQRKSSEDIKTTQLTMQESSTKTQELLDKGNELAQKGVSYLSDIATSVIDFFSSDKTDKKEKKLTNNNAEDR